MHFNQNTNVKFFEYEYNLLNVIYYYYYYYYYYCYYYHYYYYYSDRIEEIRYSCPDQCNIFFSLACNAFYYYFWPVNHAFWVQFLILSRNGFFERQIPMVTSICVV